MRKLYINIIILTLLFLPTISYARNAKDKWTKDDTIHQTICLTIKAVDWLQTREIARNPQYYERNPILGKYPSQSKVNLYFATTALLHTGISYILPREYRRTWQWVWIIIGAGYVTNNYCIGVQLKF